MIELRIPASTESNALEELHRQLRTIVEWVADSPDPIVRVPFFCADGASTYEVDAHDRSILRSVAIGVDAIHRPGDGFPRGWRRTYVFFADGSAVLRTRKSDGEVQLAFDTELHGKSPWEAAVYDLLKELSQLLDRVSTDLVRKATVLEDLFPPSRNDTPT